MLYDGAARLGVSVDLGGIADARAEVATALDVLRAHYAKEEAKAEKKPRKRRRELGATEEPTTKPATPAAKKKPGRPPKPRGVQLPIPAEPHDTETSPPPSGAQASDFGTLSLNGAVP